MTKIILGIALSTLPFISSANLLINTEACAGTEYIYNATNELVVYNPAIHTTISSSTTIIYSDTLVVPNLRTTSTGSRGSNIYIINNAESDISVYFSPTYYSDGGSTTGLETSATPESFYGIFNSSNDPLSINGSTMVTKSYGRINIGGSSALYGNGIIRWETTTCLDSSPLSVSVEHWFSQGNKFGTTITSLNNGQTF